MFDLSTTVDLSTTIVMETLQVPLVSPSGSGLWELPFKNCRPQSRHRLPQPVQASEWETRLAAASLGL